MRSTKLRALQIVYLVSLDEAKVVCFVTMRSTELGHYISPNWHLWKALDEEGWINLVSWRLVAYRLIGIFGKLLMRRGGSTWFHDGWSWGVKVLECWTIFFIEIKVNHNWKFQRIRDVPLVLLERSQGARFHGLCFERFGLKIGEEIEF
jgi:hypothetical protein